MISLAGCAAQPQIVEKAVYIDKPCERADDYAAAKWIAVRWIAIAIDGADYAATPDIAALLGNLAALKPTERNNDDDK
ncbi:MAG: hypothetical protein LBO72_08060 [Helicobacteraceae bacterium]|jgi:hypothetical protein|nr:hypothetical protein [Helicobacteraceae bacterium]